MLSISIVRTCVHSPCTCSVLREEEKTFFFLAARLRKCTRGKINVVWSRRGTGGSCGNISVIFPQGGGGKSIFCEICVEAAQLLGKRVWDRMQKCRQ